MKTGVSSENHDLAQNSEEAMQQLSSILSTYNQTTSRLFDSYEQLKRDVARLRQELRKKNEQLERKSRLAALGEMAAGMAHEIRNPLGGVQLYVSLLEGELAGQAGPLEWTQKISKGVSTLDSIVHDMLSFTQDQECIKTPACLRALIEEVLDYLRPQRGDKKPEIVLDGVDAELLVDVDLNMIKRVFLNLVLNAIEAVSPGGVIAITARACTDKNDFRVRIGIADDGPGIRPEILSTIFNPFFTTKDNGTGLGLAIVHRLVECHGGMITVSNRKPSGAEFTIWLP